MKESTKIGILGIALVICIIIFGVIAMVNSNHKAKTLILPEEICQVGKGDKMQLYTHGDTIELEYCTGRKPELQPEIRGEQVVIGDNIDYGKDTIKINADTLKALIDIANHND